MVRLKIRRRHRLRHKEISAMSSAIDAALGTKSFTESETVDRAEAPEFDVLFVDGALLGLVIDDEPFLTIRGILEYGASKRFVTVDMGAVRFVANGADVMGPGIVDADETITEGDLVWVRDEKNLRPLAVGKAIASAEGLKAKPKGKAVISLHYVGDKLWSLDEDGEQ
ncbi:MAG: RNA-binding protein [Methanobacteriota archaeon]|nr:MAG: RNA-binding protein [Euryarchaeota archaeon]